MEIFDEAQEAYQELLNRVRDLEVKNTELDAKNTELETRVKTHDYILQYNSKALADFTWQKVFDDFVVANGPGAATPSAPFDISQQSKDADGNQKIPPAFYLISAFTPNAARNVVYNGTLIVGSDISVAVNREYFTGPARYESTLEIYNVGAAVNVYVTVLKLLGVR
jgi:hypothetical protein